MKILCISDTHCRHKDLRIDTDVDMIIHAGDFAHEKNPIFNSVEATDFLVWYDDLPIKHKILIAGNHDTAVESSLIDKKTIKEFYPTITYLQHEYIIIEGIKIFGSPYTPEFKNWAFNVKREKLHKYWKVIDNDTDIVITHGPPMGILDSAGREGKFVEQVGCRSLMKRILEVKPKYHIFGHIHSERGIPNTGTRTVVGLNTTFVNASVLELISNQIISNGIEIEI